MGGQAGGRKEGGRSGYGYSTKNKNPTRQCGEPKPPAERRRPRDTGGTPGRTSDSFAVHHVPRLPRKSHRQSGGDQRTPKGHWGVHPTPLQCTKSRACHPKATGRAAETKGHRRDTGAYIRPLCSAPSPAPATQKPPAEVAGVRQCALARGRMYAPVSLWRPSSVPWSPPLCRSLCVAGVGQCAPCPS